MFSDQNDTHQAHHGDAVVIRRSSPMERMLTAAPSWLGSAILHAVILLVFCQIPWSMRSESPMNTTVSIKQEQPQPLQQRDEPPPPPNVKMHEFTPDVPRVSDNVLDEEPPSDDPLDEPNVPGLSLAMTTVKDEQVQIVKIAISDDGPPIGSIFDNRPRGRGPGGDRTDRVREPESGRCWLARVQEADGRWDSRKWGANHNCDAAVTGLAVFVFLGHGDSTPRCKYWPNVYKALNWLEQNQRSDGSWPGNFYTQGICTMVMSEAWAMTGIPRWRISAQKAVNHCCANQNPHGGWDYNGVNPGKVDTSVTGWVVMALKSAAASNLEVPSEAIDRVKNWLDAAINPDGTTGYSHQPGGTGSSGGNTAALTAVATLCREFMDYGRHDQNIRRGIEHVQARGVNLGNLYHTYYGTLAMFQYGGEHWADWRRGFRAPLIARQVRGRGAEFDGSWDTDVTYGQHGGRVYSTAMAVLCLEAEYLYLPMLQRM